jgi:hypothetical protein
MIRFVFRALALFALAVAVVMAVLDATRSIGASHLMLTPLGESWYSVSPETLNLSQALIQRYTLPMLWDPVMIWILNLPGFVVFAVLAALLYAIGRKPKRRMGRFASEI